jgi:hypothetical protein
MHRVNTDIQFFFDSFIGKSFLDMLDGLHFPQRQQELAAGSLILELMYYLACYFGLIDAHPYTQINVRLTSR